MWMCAEGCQGRFPRGHDGCSCRQALCSVREKAAFPAWRLPQVIAGPGIGTKLKNVPQPVLGVSSLSICLWDLPLRLLELRELKAAKMPGRTELLWQQLLPGDSSVDWNRKRR